MHASIHRLVPTLSAALSLACLSMAGLGADRSVATSPNRQLRPCRSVGRLPPPPPPPGLPPPLGLPPLLVLRLLKLSRRVEKESSESWKETTGPLPWLVLQLHSSSDTLFLWSALSASVSR